jgi:23S rRNA-/tRNA-specific pseudouridylate synthase
VKEVKHLKGGIHKYLDQYGNSDDCLWQGKNFVFDGRGAHKATETSGPTNNTATTNKAAVSSHKVVGKCSYCPTPYDTFHPKCICTVCREPTLVCPECKKGLKEYHCRNHEHLKACYFTDLAPFSGPHLKDQLVALQTLIEEIAVGRKFKQRRKTLKKQCDKILERLAEIGTDEVSSFGVEEKRDSACRSCGETVCSGNCWGFHGLKRKRILDERNQQSENGSPCVGKSRKANTGEKRSTNNVHLQEQKKLYKRKLVEELTYLELARPVSAYVKNRLRVPPPCTRVLQTNAKGKWCGKTLLPVLQNEYSELAKTERLEKIFRRGLLRLNGEKVTSLEQAESLKLKNMDVISRIVHWHEPPIQVPSGNIGVEKVELPDTVQEEYSLENALVYICNKPSSVPVHPAGPYLSNSMTIMVEAQEGLVPRSLIPCHRIDRVTSGLTICCIDVKVARLIQARIEQGLVQKLYLAKVHGSFPESCQREVGAECTEEAKWQWRKNSVLQVDAPIETVDPANGIRRITAKGKSSSSLFKILSYDAETDTSIISCRPLTGRSHQLRVHLEWLGFSIVNDTQYGGKRADLDSCSLMQGVERLADSMKEQQDGGKAAAELSSEDIQAAKEICSCCHNFSSSFTVSQLLQGGHEICLHASRYQIPFLPKNKKMYGINPIAKLELQVSPPVWSNDIHSDVWLE